MDPPADHEGEVARRRSLRSSAPPPRRRGTVGSRYMGLLLLMSFICFVSTWLIYNRITPYLEVMSLSIDQPFNDDRNLGNNKNILSADNYFQPTAFHEHIQLRQSNYVYHNNLIHSAQSTFGTGTNSNVRISFQLHNPKAVPIENTFNPDIKCPLGKVMQGKKHRAKPSGEIRDGILPPSLTSVVQGHDYPREGRVLDFTATISTNLKMLLIGDSVLVQLAQAFDEMVGCRLRNITSGNGTGFCRPRDSIHEAWNGHDGRTIMPSTIGGGVSALWRMTGLLSKSREGKQSANAPGGGWSMSEVTSFLNHHLPVDEGTARSDDGKEAGNSTRTLQRFDAVVFRVMHGWMKR